MMAAPLRRALPLHVVVLQVLLQTTVPLRQVLLLRMQTVLRQTQGMHNQRNMGEVDRRKRRQLLLLVQVRRSIKRRLALLLLAQLARRQMPKERNRSRWNQVVLRLILLSRRKAKTEAGGQERRNLPIRFCHRQK